MYAYYEIILGFYNKNDSCVILHIRYYKTFFNRIRFYRKIANYFKFYLIY